MILIGKQFSVAVSRDPESLAENLSEQFEDVGRKCVVLSQGLNVEHFEPPDVWT